jgi:hypothetical protein
LTRYEEVEVVVMLVLAIVFVWAFCGWLSSLFKALAHW